MPESILIIDDEPPIAAALAIRLRAADYVVHCAMNGLEGLRLVRNARPDAVILDIRLPDIDGFEVCTRIKGDHDIQATPIIFLSANANSTVRQQALETGGAEFLCKPYNAQDVIDAVRRALNTNTHAA